MTLAELRRGKAGYAIEACSLPFRPRPGRCMSIGNESLLPVEARRVLNMAENGVEERDLDLRFLIELALPKQVNLATLDKFTAVPS